MAYKQTMVELDPTEGGDGFLTDPSAVSTTNTKNLQSIFGSSPIYAGVIDDASITAGYDKSVMHGDINDGGYWGFADGFNTDYINTPNLNDVETGAGGLPASPYVPNPASPGPGSDNPTDQPAPPDNFGQKPSSHGFGNGGSRTNPAETAKNIADTTIGHYMMGDNLYTAAE